jgi:AraC-like DNA-binding protein
MTATTAMTPPDKNLTARPPAATVSAGFARALFDFAVTRGADPAVLARAAGLEPAVLEDADRRLPFARYSALMAAAKELTGDPALALEFGAASDFRHFSVVGLLSHSSDSMTQALQQLNRYGRLVVEVEGVGDGPRFDLTRRGGALWLVDRRLNPNAFPELTESTWSRFICSARRDLSAATFALSVRVTHPAPAHRGAYERLWQVPVTFDSDWNAIEVDPGWNDVPMAAPHNRYAFGVLTMRADALLAQLKTSQTIRGQVEALLMPRMHTGEAQADAVATALAMSRQTLYRRLKEEGATFEQVLDDLRRTMALDYLGARKVSVNETAYLVGFSDPAAFSRAFKRWTGASPRAWRAQNGA